MRRELIAEHRLWVLGRFIFAVFVTSVLHYFLNFNPDLTCFLRLFVLHVYSVFGAGEVEPGVETDLVVHLGEEGVYALVLVDKSIEHVFSAFCLVFLLLGF